MLCQQPPEQGSGGPAHHYSLYGHLIMVVAPIMVVAQNSHPTIEGQRPRLASAEMKVSALKTYPATGLRLYNNPSAPGTTTERRCERRRRETLSKGRVEFCEDAACGTIQVES